MKQKKNNLNEATLRLNCHLFLFCATKAHHLHLNNIISSVSCLFDDRHDPQYTRERDREQVEHEHKTAHQTESTIEQMNGRKKKRNKKPNPMKHFYSTLNPFQFN